MVADARAQLPELPIERATRLERELALPAERARELAFRTELADYFETAVALAGTSADAIALANWIPQLVERIGSDADPGESKVSPEAFASLVGLVAGKAISRDAGREVLTRLVADGGDPQTIVEAEGLQAVSVGLTEFVQAAIAADPEAAEKVRAGNMKAIGPLVGYVMRETKGRADGGEVTRLIREQVQAGQA
jgi:aspartyl-tRNA(Asn)/glutamyl-tRNA(Gln) amidotransferase subunit B